MITGRGVIAVARFARLILLLVVDLGFRSAPPQALCYRHAPRDKNKTIFTLISHQPLPIYRFLSTGL